MLNKEQMEAYKLRNPEKYEAKFGKDEPVKEVETLAKRIRKVIKK
jgi:hypothetical protein